MPQEMVKYISINQRAISTRTTLQLLKCIRFEAKGDEVFLQSTDNELTIESHFPCKVEEPGTVIIPASLIGDIFRKLPQEMTTMTEKNGVVSIDCEDVHFSLQAPLVGEFPPLPERGEEDLTDLSNSELIEAVKETEFAASLDDTKESITGIFFDQRKDHIRLVALDGYRLAIRTLSNKKDLPESSCIVPRRAFNEFTRAIDPQGESFLRILEGHIYMESGPLKMVSRTIDQSYIEYEDIISTENIQTKVTLSRQALVNALERASLLSREDKSNLIKMNFSNDHLLISSNSEIGSLDETLSCHIEGEDLLIAFNAKYILEGVRAFFSDHLLLHFDGELNPLLIYPEEEEKNYLYLVLPVRIAGE